MLDNKMSKHIFLVIYIFLLLYAPPIIKNVNTLLIVFVFTFVVLCTKYRKEVFDFLKKKEIARIALLFIAYFSWYFISVIFNWIFYKQAFLMNFISNMYSMALVIPITLFCVVFILIYADKNNISFNEIIKLTIYAGTIQGIICLLSFLFPWVKTILLTVLYYLTGDKLFIDEFHVARRFFGYSNGMVDAYGFGSGIIACLPLFYSLNNKKKFLLYTPLLLLIVILNSRTGLVIFGIGLLVWLGYIIFKNRWKEYANIILGSIVLLCIVILLVYLIKPMTIEWIVTDFFSFFSNKVWGTADVLFSERFWRIPPISRIFIGAGYSVNASTGLKEILGFASDVGYVNELWRTGIIGMSILLFTIFYISYVLIKRKKSQYSNLILFFLLSLLIGNVKLTIFIYNPGIVVILLYVLYELAFQKEKSATLPIYSEKQQEKISIIVPVYNAQEYLKECLDSIINQTYQNIEIILVNDGSTDNSFEICNQYAAKDDRIIVINQKNEGQASARNKGLDIAGGQFIGFVDSDDWIDLDTYDYLHSLIEKYNADSAFIKIRKKDYEEQTEYIKETVYTDEDILVEYLEYGMKTGEYSPCTYLYKRALLENLRFPKGRINEDIGFIFKALDKSHILVKSNKYGYNYRMTPNSTTRNKLKLRDFDLMKACEELEEYSKNKNEKIKKLVKQKRDRSDFSLLAKSAYYGVEDECLEKEIQIMKSNIRKNYFELLCSNMSFIRKLQLTCLVVNYDYTKRIINWIFN